MISSNRNNIVTRELHIFYIFDVPPCSVIEEKPKFFGYFSHFKGLC
jgi:hypothetical protein